MSLGLGGRLSLAFAALVAVTALSVGAGSSLATDRQVSAELDRSLTQRAAEIADGRRSPPEPRQAVTEPPAPADAPDVSVQLLSGDGEVTSTVGVELPVEGADLEEAATGGAPTVRTVTADGAQLRMVTMHLPGGGAVQVATSLDDSADLLGVLRSRITVIALGMATFAGVLGWLLAQRITRPLRSLTDAVDAVAETQDLSVDVPTGRDEIGRLGRGFDRCLGALERSRQVQTRMMQDAAHELRTPLTSISANIDWLRRADDLDPAQRASALDSVRRELDGLNTAVGEIVELAFDGSAQGDLGRVDVAEVVTSAVEEFAERTGRRVT
ncbi:MAG: HAMP domain-containing histidine kinase, partial [Microthrixaceae bacterium]|nr:HAMP domain-containing histidine kinase [Microthrixaceae bacterium]